VKGGDGMEMNQSSTTKDYIEKIIDKYSDMIIRIAYIQMKNMSDAEDAAQDVFLKLIEKPRYFESSDHEKAWLIRVAINLCKDRKKMAWLRKNKTIPLQDSLCNITQEKSEKLEAIMELPMKYRSIILLYYYEDYSIKEISNIMGIKEATIGSQLHRARELLKTKLKGGLGDE